MGNLVTMFNGFAEWTSIPHLNVYAESKGRALRLMWLVLFGASCVLFGMQVQSLVDKYHRYEKATSVKLVYDGTVDFPAVTICSLNPYKFSALGAAPELSTLMSAYNFFSQTSSGKGASGRKKKRKKRAATSGSGYDDCVAALAEGSSVAQIVEFACYRYFPEPMNIQDWDANCTAQGGRLAEPLSHFTLEHLSAFPRAWVGAHRFGDSTIWHWGRENRSEHQIQARAFIDDVAPNQGSRECALLMDVGELDDRVCGPGDLEPALCMFHPPDGPAHCAATAATTPDKAIVVAGYSNTCYLGVTDTTKGAPYARAEED